MGDGFLEYDKAIFIKFFDSSLNCVERRFLEASSSVEMIIWR
jgi:hypothetical protein